MSERSFVVIFFFWAVLTIVTPTLILLSESSKTALDCHGKSSEETNVRQMMEEGSQKIIHLLVRKALAPAPAPAPATYSGTRKQPEQDQPPSWRKLPIGGLPSHC